MSDYAQTGTMTAGLLGLRHMLWSSGAFLEFTDCSTASEAEEKQKVKLLGDWPRQSDRAAGILEDRPIAVVWPADRLDIEAVAFGASVTFAPGQDLVLLLAAPAEFADDDEASGMAFLADLDSILNELKDLAGVGTHLPIKRIRLVLAPARSDPADDESGGGAFWEAVFLVSWGR